MKIRCNQLRKACKFFKYCFILNKLLTNIIYRIKLDRVTITPDESFSIIKITLKLDNWTNEFHGPDDKKIASSDSLMRVKTLLMAREDGVENRSSCRSMIIGQKFKCPSS